NHLLTFLGWFRQRVTCTEQKSHLITGSKFHGSRLPWRDLICILETISLDSTPGVSTQRERKARSGPGVQG
ncbi:MAG: hypothetical protein KKB35_08015, partial [Proteobacteria bacterium]|nr:hypothetical protein [Pseudomonadota bacterium]